MPLKTRVSQPPTPKSGQALGELPCEVMSSPSPRGLWEEEGILLRGGRAVSTKTNTF